MLKDYVLTELKNAVGSQNVLTSKASMDAYAYDSSPFIHTPEVVVFANTTQQVSDVMKLADREGIVVVARGAGTSLSGGAVPIHNGIVLVLNHFNKILDIDIVNEAALVEPGVVNNDLQAAAAKYGYMFAPDPSSQIVSTVGGNVAEGAGGMRGVKYGVMRDHLLGLELVLADGSIVTTGGLNKFLPQLDFTGIFCASEGTLAIATKILVKLVRMAESVRTMMAVFSSLDEAGKAVSAIIARGIEPTILEIMDKAMTRAVDDYIHAGFPRDAEAVLLIEVDGYEIELDRKAEKIVAVCNEYGASEVRKAGTEQERQTLWKARRSGNGALGRIKPGYVVQDVTVPRNKLSEMLQCVLDIAKKYDVIITQVFHAGDGNMHPHLLYDPYNKEEFARVEQATREIVISALNFGGTLTGEHGIGIEKIEYMPLAFSKEDLNFMHTIKNALDPHGVLNRGKILEPV